MINKQFGVYLVLSKDEELSKQKKRTYWHCECQKCKTVRSVRADGLNRLPNSCPDCKNDISGNKYGKITVLYKTRIDNNGHSYWMCQCECGKNKEISGSNLKSGYTLSCGCLHREIISEKLTIDLTGQKFGKLTVIKRISEIGDGHIKWLCKCECGSIIEAQGSNLKSGHTTSCGCIKSKGELKIKEILTQLNLDFKTEYIFKDFTHRRYDFYIPSLNTCIEYDGKQHFKFVGTWHETEEEFQKSILRDKEKDDYCNKNHINYRVYYCDNF